VLGTPATAEGAWRPVAFETCHAIVPAALFVGVLGCSMFCVHPVLAAISLAGALALLAAGRGVAEAVRSLAWQLPMLAIVCLANPLFGGLGTTELLRVGPVRVCAESLVAGATFGAMMVAAATWCLGARYLVDGDALVDALGSPMPNIALAVSMALGLVPRLARRIRQTATLRRACTAVGAPSNQGVAAASATTFTGVLSSSLEESLTRADVLRARGWGRRPGPARCRTARFHLRDALWLAAICALLACAICGTYTLCAAWEFYPVLAPLGWSWAYVPFALLMALPAVALVVGEVRA